MRSTALRRHHLACFVALLLVAAWDGPVAASETQRVPSDADCNQPLPAVLAPGALPASAPVAPDLHTHSAPPVVAAAWSLSAPEALRSQVPEWRTTRRPFTEVVSYRTTGPPARIS